MLFLLYTSLCCLYAGCLLVARFVSCSASVRQCGLSPLQTALCILNFVEALVFGLFCVIMMADQLTAILDNTPGIDALQHRPGQRKGRYDALQAVFGEPLSLRWLLPLGLPASVRRDFDSELAAAAAAAAAATATATAGHAEPSAPPQLQQEHGLHEHGATLGSALRQGGAGQAAATARRGRADEERKREEYEGKDGSERQREAAKAGQRHQGGAGSQEGVDEDSEDQQPQQTDSGGLQPRRPHSSRTES